LSEAKSITQQTRGPAGIGEFLTRGPAGIPDFLVHNEGDLVAVSVQDVEIGRRRIAYMDSGREIELDVVEAIPLGHKVALEEFASAQQDVIEYGVRVGLTRTAIRKGELVHVHNIRSARWKNGS